MDEHDELQQRLRHLGAQPIEPSRQAADLIALAGVRRSPRRAPGFLGSKVRLAAAFLAGLLLGSTGLAAADALPDPAQHVAHNVLAQVGVNVPNPDRYHAAECGSEVKKNHGAYVRDDHSLAKSDCGKPIGAGDERENGEQGNGKGADKGPCHGKPPWAGNKTMTDAEAAAAKAERTALCGEDADEVEPNGTGELEAEDEAESTTTTEAPTTTTESTTTTTESTTTTSSTTTTTAAP